MGDLDSRSLQQLERGPVDLFDLFRAEYRQPGFETQFRIDHQGTSLS
jgi:hypothetical protein